jgi:murein DD-endopeptidase MepM/ murein hydrolase activator NlpD
LNGPVAVLQGGATPEVNYHVAYPDQRWAYDLGVRVNGLLHRDGGENLEDYYAYGKPVFAPADGVVVRSHDGEPDQDIRQGRFASVMPGNHIVLEVGPGEFLFMGHFQPRSVRVRAGDRVTAGQQIAAVGNSGRSPFPHMHMHLQDSDVLSWAEGIPLLFHDYMLDGQHVSEGIPTGGEQRQIVMNAPVEQASGLLHWQAGGLPYRYARSREAMN